MSVLSVRGLSVGYGARRFVDGLDLDLNEGEVLSVDGPSGSGKTSILRVLALLDAPLAGEVRRDDTPVTDVPRFRREVVFVAQRPTLFAGTLDDNLRRAFFYRTAGGPFDPDRAQAQLEEFGLVRGLSDPADSLSEGERQRLCLVRALLLDPKALLLDEPTSALDEDAVGVVEDRLRRFVEAGGALVLVSHDAAQRARLATRKIEVKG